ncbi:hypothetical protein [Pontibacter akesuensis]|nr:hypothetical protein [Pontibacter akesuensis]
MEKTLLLVLALLLLGACSGDSTGTNTQEQVDNARIDQAPPLPPDAIYATRPLVSGKLYSRPDFKASTVVYFDTSQQVYILDTANVMFAKARMRKDTTSHTGYIPKTILPERR